MQIGINDNVGDVIKLVSKLSREERAKLDVETLVNVNNIKKHITRPTLKSKGIDKGYIVV